MRNLKSEIRTSRSRPAFTLVEMLVAVAMGAALVAAAATVFTLASDAIGTSEANTQINSQLRVLFSWLDRDFARIRLDGPLVITFDDIEYLGADGSIETAHLDRVFFLVSGDIAALTYPESVSLALVLYGHDSYADNLQAIYAGPPYAPYEEISGLVLTRWARLVKSDAIPPGPILHPDGYKEFYQGEPSPAPPAPGSFADFLAYWYSSVLPADPWDDFVDTFETRANITADEGFAHMLDHVISFGVTRVGLADGTIWERPAAVTPPNAPFGPSYPKPAWIEFEVTLRDRNNRLPDGFTAIHRVNLPSR